MNLRELAEAMRQSNEVVSVDLEGESPARLRVELGAEEYKESWLLRLALAGYHNVRWLPAECTLIVADD